MSQHSRNDAQHLVVGVAGGIAAYKACHVVRELKEAGADVRVVPTPDALRFVGAATFEALSGHAVSTTVFDAVDEVQHVRIGQDAQGIVIAPATADVIARLAAGRANDLLTATCLVATCPVLVVPAMHTEMWLNPATQENVATLRRRGMVVMEPAHGRLTGKDTGPGRLPEPQQIAAVFHALLDGGDFSRDLEGQRVLISAGGTRENLDPVRFIGNASSGRQGFALAEIAAHKGAKVTVVAAATEDLPTPCGAEVVRVRSARELQAAIDERAAEADIIIMAAAVADYRPASVAESKMKKGRDDAGLDHVELVENPDILAGLVKRRAAGELKDGVSIVGFAAETGDAQTSAIEHGRAKLQRKGCDLLMCNEVGEGKVFGQATNQGWLLGADGSERTIELGSKHYVAAQMLAAIGQLRGGSGASGASGAWI